MNWWRLKIRLHETWHFTLLCGSIVLGIGLSSQSWAIGFASIAWLLVGLVLFMFVYWKRFFWLLIVACLAGLIIGLWRGSVDQLARQQYAGFYNQEVKVKGKVSEDIDIGQRGDYILRLKNVIIEGQHLTGEIWVSIDKSSSVQRSDIVLLSGKLQPGFGSFVASIYRADLESIWRPQPGDVALKVREDFGEKVRYAIEEPAASLGMGYLTGQRRSLPEELDDSLRVAGLTHIVVASGYNLTILVRMMKRLFDRRSRYLTAFLSGLLIVGFIAVTGMSPSMMRAGLIAALALAAWYFGRKFHPITLLAFAAALTGLIEPSYVWGNLGWQLSFAAFAGVMVMAPLLQAYFFGDKKPGVIRQIIGETVSAQILTAPLLVFTFSQLSNVALIANVLVLPLVPLAMLMTWLTGLAGYFMPAAGVVIGLPTQWLLDYMVQVATTTASLSWAQSEVDITFTVMVGLYILIIIGCWWMWRVSKRDLRYDNIIE